MTVEITVLMDNVAGDGLSGEWGFSCAVETADFMLLWDCGQTEAFMHNARELGIAPQQADALALSHGHYDHAGGLPALMKAGFKGQIYAHSEVGKDRYSVTETPPASIGVQSELPAYEAVGESYPIHDMITMVTDIPRHAGNHASVSGFCFDCEGTLPDPVRDDSFLLLNTRKGPVVLLGCCHSGLANSLAVLKERHGIAKVHAIIGGLHLYDASAEQAEQAFDALKASGASLIVPGHCTGENAVRMLFDRTEAIIRPMHSGMRLKF